MNLKFITYLYLLFFFSFSYTVLAQKKPAKIWATASFNKNNVMVGEPLVVTITVYTSTWFTKPPVFEEIQIKGALLVRLEQRSGAKTVTIGRKQYPAIEQRFVVYPNAIGENTLPSFKVKTTSPPEGDYKGLERTVATKERKFMVQGPPEGMDTSKWLTAYDVTISETWDKPLKNVTAGDVLERRISIRATGALAAAIPPLDLTSIDFGTLYPKTPILGNFQNTASFTGSRTEIINYLIEKDGTFTIPETSISWFSLRTKQLESRKLGPIEIKVAPNPDLAFILTRQKELQAELAKEEIPEILEEKPFEFLGLNWWQLILSILAALSILKFSYDKIRVIQFQNRQRNKEKLESEAHYFQLVKEASKKGDTRLFFRQLMFWYDRFRTEKYKPELSDFITKSKDVVLSDKLEDIMNYAYREDKMEGTLTEAETLFDELSKARNKSQSERERKTKEGWIDLNPK